uniref:Uncharacterized protein n=1 Tax=Iconisemion striatum TaxID=60296 RepID=A0A1A7YBI4_9TELE
MEDDGDCVLIPAETLRLNRDPCVNLWCCRVTVCFLVSCFSGLMLEPDTEQWEKEQSLKLTRCCMSRERGLLQRDSNKEKDQHATSDQGGLDVFPNGCSIYLRSGTKSFLQRCNYTSVRAARRCDLKFQENVSAREVEAADRRAGRTRLNLHFCLSILFSTNKLTPEKT